MHGLIFFYIQKFADEATSGKTTWLKLRDTVTASDNRYLPNEVYPDEDAIELLQKIADAHSVSGAWPFWFPSFMMFSTRLLIEIDG